MHPQQPQRPQRPPFRPRFPGRMKEQRRRDYAPRSEYPPELDQVAGDYARRIIRALQIDDTAANWRRLRDILLDALVPQPSASPDEALDR